MPKSTQRCSTNMSHSSKLPSSNSSSSRSRAVSLPLACWAAMRFSPPPSRARARLASSACRMSCMVRDLGGNSEREIDLHAIAGGVAEEELVLAGHGGALFVERHAGRPQPLGRGRRVGARERDMVEGGGRIRAGRQAQCFTRALLGQMQHRLPAGIQPVAAALEGRPVAALQPQHFAVEVVQLAQQVDRRAQVDVVQPGDHGDRSSLD
mmetsp:Transcript_7885/g.14981  ORF Transcript_7885/g.14981 Transcript_7885/m.14981 type:complete len:209 (+) Transcript_7885:86-712(+)